MITISSMRTALNPCFSVAKTSFWPLCGTPEPSCSRACHVRASQTASCSTRPGPGEPRKVKVTDIPFNNTSKWYVFRSHLIIARRDLMPVKIVYKNRRVDMDRRKNFPTYNDPERRSGLGRRKLDEKLRHLIEINVKDQNKKKPKPVQKSPGNVILRRKGE